MKRQSGFTLVEIAIVLVVIGLLLGGVLKGQELVLNSQIRSVINEFNNVASARFAYQDRYREIPGDDTSAGGATGRWGATATNGDGDRIVNGLWNVIAPVAGTTEGGIFWHHLRNDGLVSGPRSNAAAGNVSFALPENAFNGDIGTQEGAFSAGILGPVICQDYIPAKAALVIDARLDDDPGDGTGSDTGSLQSIPDGGDALADAAMTAYPVSTPNARTVLCREL